MARRRLDAELVRRGLASSRAEAQEAVHRGLVLVGGTVAAKPATMVGEDQPLELAQRLCNCILIFFFFKKGNF